LKKIGHEVSWQKLGKGFATEQFRFQILDEGLYESWKAQLNEILATAAA